MSYKIFSIPLLLIVFSCAERPRLPTEINDIPDEPSVANEVNDFSFEIGAASFFYIESYSLDFNSNVVVVYVTVSNYSAGTGTLVLQGEGNTLIFSHSLSVNQDEKFRLSGTNIPETIQLAFNNYQGHVTIRIEPDS